VAALAGRVTWYTWFEQGRAIGVASAFLDRLADALRLSAPSAGHLFVLAAIARPRSASRDRAVPVAAADARRAGDDRPPM